MTLVESAGDGGVTTAENEGFNSTLAEGEEEEAAVKKSEDRSLLQREGLSPKEAKNKASRPKNR